MSLYYHVHVVSIDSTQAMSKPHLIVTYCYILKFENPVVLTYICKYTCTVFQFVHVVKYCTNNLMLFPTCGLF